MAKMTLDQLTESLYKDTYTPRTEDQLRQEAENRYQTQYNQQKLTAQQNFAAKDLAYEQQLKQLQDSLSDSQQALRADTANSIASANRYMITRGMQRSSYGAANQANLFLKGQQNLLNLQKQYDTNAAGIGSNRALLAQQLADTLAQYDIDYLNDVQAYIDEQKQIDYDREQAALQNQNQILMALYEYGKAAGGGGGGRRSGGGSYYPADSGTENPNTSNSLFDDISDAQKLVSNYSSGALADRMQKQSKTNYAGSSSASAQAKAITGNVAKKQKDVLSAQIAGRNNR